jgi:hypothetical protein
VLLARDPQPSSPTVLLARDPQPSSPTQLPARDPQPSSPTQLPARDPGVPRLQLGVGTPRPRASGIDPKDGP